MSDIIAALFTFLEAQSGVTTLVSTRIFPEKFPAGTTANPTQMPCLTCQLIDEPVIQSHPNKVLYVARMQIDSWGGSYKSAHAVGVALHGVLEGYKGNMGSVYVGGVFRERKSDAPEPDIPLNRVSQDYVFNYA